MKKSTRMVRVPVTTCLVGIMLVMGWCSMASGATLFYDDFSGGMNWTTSDNSVSISNGNLIIASDGDYDDWAEKSIPIDLSAESPIIIKQRVKLVSGGRDYLLPDVSVFFEDSSSISVIYLPSNSGQSYGWYFGGWTGNDSNAVPGEDYWTVTKMVLTPTGGELYVKPDDAAKGWVSNQFSRVADASWSHTSINRIRIDQPWDSVNYVDYIRVSAMTAPPQPSRPDPTPSPASSKANLVLYTHGWNTSESGFTDPNGSWGQLDSALRAAVGGSDWEVQGYGWTQDSGSFLTGPGYALAYATVHGTSVGDQIGGDPNVDYDNVHIIAHSAGSAFAAAAAERIKTLSPDTYVHITLLDPYIGIGGAWFSGTWFGVGNLIDGITDADWTDNYFTRDVLTGVLTQLPLSKAHNVDVTGLDPALLSSHGWPVDWYRATVDGIGLPAGSGGYGFPLSVEGGGWNPSAYPVGNDPVVLGGGSSEPTDIVVRHDTVLNVLDQLRANSSTGTVNVAGTGFSMLTGSPVWMTTLVETNDIVNFLTFEADFTSDPGAEGLLAVYWDNELLGIIDERYVLDCMQEYTMFLPGNFEPGAYTLSFRLDPYTTIDSSVLIDNVATGFVTPEPATLTLLAFAGLAMLRRRRKR